MQVVVQIEIGVPMVFQILRSTIPTLLSEWCSLRSTDNSRNVAMKPNRTTLSRSGNAALASTAVLVRYDRPRGRRGIAACD